MSFFEPTVYLIKDLIAAGGYPGLALLMALDATILPVPSAAVMGFAGFLCHEGRFDIVVVTLVGAIGSTMGSLLMYLIAAYGGRPLLDRYGSMLGLKGDRLRSTERWFDRHGDRAVFLAQLLPVLRDLIPFPAGLVKMNIGRFALLSFLGSIPFCLALAWVGLASGPSWEGAIGIIDQYDMVLVLSVAVLLGAYYVLRRYGGRNPSGGEDT
ncbi:MAG: DedA family protein [Methanomassiliicoccus sp.]|nr:DedA family protein [Methanomassiliicoccus sp.]